MTERVPHERRGNGVTACTRCLYNSDIPGITFDAQGRCNYCSLHDEMDAQYPTGELGRSALQALATEMREAGQRKDFDCIVGVSGGCDSSYLVYQMVSLGLRPLAVHFDNTWNSPVATTNIYNVLSKLNVELSTYVVNNREYDDIYRSFMLAGVPDLEAPTDIALISTLYREAERRGVKYIIEGHSFRTEGISPLGWLYMDGRYISAIHRRFGKVPTETFPNLPMWQFVKWAALDGYRRIRPLYHLDYDKEATKAFLANEFGWQWYGGHHLENRFTAFYHSYFLPTRFNIDGRLLGYSALVRSGQLDRQKGEALLEEAPHLEPEILDLVKKRLGFDDEEFASVMALPHRSHHDYPTYLKFMRSTKPLWWALYKADRVPKSFYVKFAGGKS